MYGYAGSTSQSYAAANRIDFHILAEPIADIPQTSDYNMPWLWAGLAMLAAGGLVIARRKHKA
jgi:LPXTG-motif cell wall-anchored protein